MWCALAEAHSRGRVCARGRSPQGDREVAVVLKESKHRVNRKGDCVLTGCGSPQFSMRRLVAYESVRENLLRMPSTQARRYTCTACAVFSCRSMCSVACVVRDVTAHVVSTVSPSLCAGAGGGGAASVGEDRRGELRRGRHDRPSRPLGLRGRRGGPLACSPDPSWFLPSFSPRAVQLFWAGLHTTFRMFSWLQSGVTRQSNVHSLLLPGVGWRMEGRRPHCCLSRLSKAKQPASVISRNAGPLATTAQQHIDSDAAVPGSQQQREE